MSEPTPEEKAADEILSLIKQKTVSKLIPIPSRRQILKRVRAAVEAEAVLWHETLLGKRDMHSDGRVKAVADRVQAETERCAGADPLLVGCANSDCLVGAGVACRKWNEPGSKPAYGLYHKVRIAAAVRAPTPEPTDD
jgi:phosphopantothenoylcysteine synthetase/decarboxylase